MLCELAAWCSSMPHSSPCSRPQSLLLAINVAGLAASRLAGSRGAARWATGSLLAQAIYVVGGLAVIRAPASVWRAFCSLPRFLTRRMVILMGAGEPRRGGSARRGTRERARDRRDRGPRAVRRGRGARLGGDAGPEQLRRGAARVSGAAPPSVKDDVGFVRFPGLERHVDTRPVISASASDDAGEGRCLGGSRPATFAIHHALPVPTQIAAVCLVCLTSAAARHPG